MKRPYTKIADFLVDFAKSDERILEVDSLQWMSEKKSSDSIRRCIRKKGYKDMIVFRRNERVFVVKL